MKEEKVPHTRKPLHCQRQWVGCGEDSEHGGECRNRGTEGKGERVPHRGSVPTSTHQPERLVSSPTRVGGGCELRLGFQRSNNRERTGVSCVNTD